MGMYTIIEDDLGQRWQIKCGHDYCDTYKIGEEVPFKLHDEAGEGDFLDGVYEAYGDIGHHHKNTWVIIKDHKVTAVVPQVAEEYSDAWRAERDELISTWKVAFDRSLWPEEAWGKKAEIERIAEEKYQAWCAEKGYDPKAIGTPAAYYLQAVLQQQSLSRQILPPAFLGKFETLNDTKFKIEPAESPEKLTFMCYQEIGAEVYSEPEPWPEGLDIQTTPVLKGLGDLKVGDKIVAPTLFGFVRATVEAINGTTGHAVTAGRGTMVSLSYEKRAAWQEDGGYSAWTTSSSANLKAIAKLELYDEPKKEPTDG